MRANYERASGLKFINTTETTEDILYVNGLETERLLELEKEKGNLDLHTVVFPRDEHNCFIMTDNAISDYAKGLTDTTDGVHLEWLDNIVTMARANNIDAIWFTN